MERRLSFGLVGITLLAFALRVYRLDFQSLWRDEVDAVIFATRSLGAILDTFTRVGENGPLYFLGLHAWIAIVGQSEFAIRFPSVFFGVLAVLVTYRLGRELLGNEVGFVAAVLMAVSPYHIWYGQEAKMYALISFLAPLSLLLVLRIARGGSRWLWPAWAALMAAFLYIHLFATMMVLVALAWGVALLRSRPRPTPLLGVAVLLGVVAGLPVARWLLPALLTPTQTGYYPYSLGEMATIVLFNFSMGLRPSAGLWPVTLYVMLLMAGCAPLVYTVAGPRWPQARPVLLVVLYLVVPLLAIWLVSLRRPTFTDRYLIIALPAFYLLMATGLRVIRTLVARASAKPYAHGIGGAVTIVLTTIVVVSSLPFVWAQTHHPYKADFRAATRFLVESAAPEDLIMFLMPYVQRGFAYYHPQPVRSAEPPYTRGMSETQADAALRALTAGSRRVWLFLSEADFWDAAGLIGPWFERNATRCHQAEFAYIEVRCYDMR